MRITPTASRYILISSMFIMGACGLAYEYVISLMGNNLMGTSHEQIFIIIGLMLFAMGLGSGAQRVFKRDLLDTFLILEVLLGMLGGFSAIAIYAAFGFWLSFEPILYGFALLIGGCIGMEIPLLIRINRDYSESLRTNLSEILSVDYIGSLAGAFLFTFVLLTRFSLPTIAFLLGITNLGIALVGLVYFKSLLRRFETIALFWGLGAVALGIGLFFADTWTVEIEQRYYKDPIVFRKTTKFQHVVLTQKKDRLNMYINGNLQFSSQDEEVYHELLVHAPLSLGKSRKRVLILGGGDGLALREVLKYHDVEEVHLVDLDPEIVALSARHPIIRKLNRGAFDDARVNVITPGGLREGPQVDMLQRNRRPEKAHSRKKEPVARIRVLYLDADLFLRKARGKYDQVIIDFPDPSRLELAKLYSLDFFRNLRRRLSPGAMVAIQSTSPYFGRDAFLCIGKTLEAAGFKTLPYHYSVPSFAVDWGWFLAWTDPRPVSELRQKIQSLQRFQVPTAFLTPAGLRASLAFGKGRLEPLAPIRINTRMRPVIVNYYRRSWRRFN